LTILSIIEETPAITGAELITEAVTKDIFIVSLDQEGEWYRFHHLFRELMF
jgi:ATP/maltotriose-dependent transcriptional regulator MalT